MTILGLLHLSLPPRLVEFAGMWAMPTPYGHADDRRGVPPERRPVQIGDIIKILGVRYIIGIALAFGSVFYPAAPAGIPPGTCDRIFGPGGQRQPAFYRADGQ